jgi:transposase-like protein
MDETYIKLKGKWVYLYRAVDSQGNTIDFLLRGKRDAGAAKAFFKKAIKHNGRPTKATVDKSGSNKEALDFCNLGVSEKEKMAWCVRRPLFLPSLFLVHFCSCH